MEHFERCTARDVAAITRSLSVALIDQRVTLWMDAGVTERVEDGDTILIPNGTLSIHLYVNGGAVDERLPARPKPTADPPTTPPSAEDPVLTTPAPPDDPASAQPTAWSGFEGHDYSRTGKHDPLNCRPCLREHVARIAAPRAAPQPEPQP